MRSFSRLFLLAAVVVGAILLPKDALSQTFYVGLEAGGQQVGFFQTVDVSSIAAFDKSGKRIGVDTSVALTRGLTSNNDLWTWHRAALSGQIERRNIVVTVYDQTASVVQRFEVANVWPAKLDIAPHPSVPGVLVETITFVDK